MRSSELRALTRANFELDEVEPYVWLGGDDTKNRQAAELPLWLQTVTELRQYLSGKHPKAIVFTDMTEETSVAVVLRADLKAAGVPCETDSGRVDFHALRGTCLTWLADAGTPLKVLQEFARHSTPILTMNCYARTLRGSLSGAAARLPDLATLGATAAKATGTDDGSARQTTPKTTPSGAPQRASACARLVLPSGLVLT